MPKLTRNSSKAPAQAAKAKQSNPMLLLGIGLAVAAFLMLYMLASGASKKGEVLVARGPISPFATIQDAQLQAKQVPAESITDQDLTPAEYKAKKAEGKTLISRVEILPGQRVDTGAVSAASLGSLSAVKSDERVIAMPATFPGAAAGVAIPGSVVDIFRASNGAAAATEGGEGASEGNLVVSNAKVLAVGVGPETAAAVRPESRLKRSNQSDGSGGSVVVVLAVKKDQAGAVVTAGQVWLALDPHYSFTASGTLCKIEQCAQAGGRASETSTEDPAASTDPAAQDPAEMIPGEESTEEPTTGTESETGTETTTTEDAPAAP